jgi:CDP-6-deoxy-D-xylo-4-hexulose-3-dehydrase
MLENIDDKLKELLLEVTQKKIDPPPFVPGISHIPVTGKVIDNVDLLNLVDSSLDAWFTSGRFTDEFEKKSIRVSWYETLSVCK